ncbi:MAG: hypothetical protein MAG715_00481 [Methanonatronarchaeales archaeon]|nr:hypothetical protein [Methanonatronarchaeales archaeon]
MQMIVSPKLSTQDVEMIIGSQKNSENFITKNMLDEIDSLEQLKDESKGNKVKLVRGKKSKEEIANERDEDWYLPDKILVTTLFTYWKPAVVEAVEHYNELFSTAEITAGGVYASLMPEDCKTIPGIDKVHIGTHQPAEQYKPAYHLIEEKNGKLDYQIIHTSRGCKRECDFCGVWKINPEFKNISEIKDNIVPGKRKLVIYDNNMLMNPHIEHLLDELIELKDRGDILWCEAQSGFDGRVLTKKPQLGKKIKKAGFRYPRIAWDWGIDQKSQIKEQVEILKNAGYSTKEIFIFMIYNWEIPFREMEEKRIACFDFGTQIADCRYRPLNQTYDNYNPRAYKKGQTEEDYHIHKGWTDAKVRQFRKNVRRQNICIRHAFSFYSKDLERKRVPRMKVKEIMGEAENMDTKKAKKEFLDSEKIHFWFPDEIHLPRNKNQKLDQFD